MIEFQCACRQFKFSLADDMAGGLIQCPRCRRLVDIPTLGEIGHLDSEGGYKFEEKDEPPSHDPRKVGEAARAFHAARTDAHGEDIDLRVTFEQVQRAGVTQEHGMLPSGRPIPPKYDQTTGEIIRALPVRGEEPKRVLPVEALGPDGEPIYDAIPLRANKLDYSAHLNPNITLGGAFIVLLRPVNLLVMTFVFLAQMLLHMTAMIVAFGFIFAVFAPVLFLFALIGHYGNVIEEIGPHGRDELPTLMRNASFGEDVWWPFVQVVFGFLAAYLPLIILPFFKLPAEVAFSLRIAFLALGTFLLPATIITQVTSGTLENIRPDRVIGVIYICGLRYLVVVSVFVLAAAVYLFGLGAAGSGVFLLFRTGGIALGLSTIAAGYAALAVGVYLMHVVCWQLGMLYRAYHDQFPWIMQRHIPTKMMERTRPRAGQLITPAHVKPPTRG